MSVLATPPVPPRRNEAETGRGHLPVLDGLRGLAILLVMEHHFWGLTFGFASRPPTLAIDRFARHVVGVGWSGVDLFFVLSGFLITSILYDAKRSNFYFRNFYARRFLRIFPLYYAFLVVVLFILPHFPRLTSGAQIDGLRDNQLWYWTYMVNTASAIKQFDAAIPLAHSQFWSLALEEQFYLIWPLLILLLSRRQMMGLCGVLVVGALAFRIYLVQPETASFANLNAAHVLLPARVDTLALGSLIALAPRGGVNLNVLRPAALIAGTVSLVTLIILFVTHDGLLTIDKDVETIGLSALAFMFASLLLLAVTSGPGTPLHRVFTSPPMRMLGRYSYAIYVVHLLLAFTLAVEFDHRDLERTVFGSQIPLNVLFSLLCTTISISIAWLSWHLFEKQILKLKRYVPYGREKSEVPVPSSSERPVLAAP